LNTARETFDWDEMCEVELPVPSIQKQRAIVKEYNTIVKRIQLNEELNRKLEETAQAVYKHWFVDFEFPIDNNFSPDGEMSDLSAGALAKEEGQRGYKTSGGKMVWNEELGKEIPVGWEVKPFTTVINLKGGGTPSTNNQTFWDGKIPFFTPKDISNSYYVTQTEKYLTEDGLKNCSSKKYAKNSVFITARGTVGAIAMAGVPMAMNQSCYAIIGTNKINQFFAHQLTIETIKTLKEEAIGAVFKALVTKDFDGQLVIEPVESTLVAFEFKVKPLYELLLIKSNQLKQLNHTKDLILSKMTKPKTEQ
jgi:type I restriction enzyme S subunit